MKSFLKYTLASCLGIFVAIGVITIGLFIIIGGLVASIQSGSGDIDIDEGTILHLKLNEMIPEHTNNTKIDMFDFSLDDVVGLHDILKTIEHATEDDDIAGIYMTPFISNIGAANARLLRIALKEFKESGKFVYVYSDAMTQQAYYISSVADSIIINPNGLIDVRGFGTIMPFFKETLDKLGVEMQIYYAGKFKSATEPFRRTDMSEESKLQTREYLQNMYEIFLSDVSESRGTTIEDLEMIVDSFYLRDPEKALAYGMIDVIAYEGDVERMIKARLGWDDDDDKELSKVSIYDYYEGIKLDKGDGKNKIAVVYAEGVIQSGKHENGTISDRKYVNLIQKLRKDEDIKALVLRVNSPGGSAAASDNIWHEIEMFRETGRPVVVSMGDLAASGGYYISCNADRIFAQPNTITGSIGVFGMIPNIKELMNEHLGIHFDSVRTAHYSTSFNTIYKFGPEEDEIIQDIVDRIYAQFIGRVAEGRGLTEETVKEIAQGRVYTGLKAKELRLVDEIGSLDEAILEAAIMAEVDDDFRIREYPHIKTPIEQLIQELTNAEEARTKLIERKVIEVMPEYRMIREILEGDQVQARLLEIPMW